ncbi:uncharacterized protein DS421_12g368610 [Arachis hypogaea]|nr:uncharacterized protein DS421_12g368610 [Arachis hypogaea]
MLCYPPHFSFKYELEDFRNGPPKPPKHESRAILMKSCADTCADAQTCAFTHFAKNPIMCVRTSSCAHAH